LSRAFVRGHRPTSKGPSKSSKQHAKQRRLGHSAFVQKQRVTGSGTSYGEAYQYLVAAGSFAVGFFIPALAMHESITHRCAGI